MNNWQLRKRPICLEKRFEFENYSETRDFLDRLGDFTESLGKFPDISFGKTYVNITLRPDSDDIGAELVDSDYQFADQIDALFN